MAGSRNFALKSSGLQQLADGLWICDGRVKFMGMWIPTRMAVIGYTSPDSASQQDLIVYSPFPPVEELVTQISRLGRCKFIVAPNTMHHLWVAEFHAAFPGSMLVGCKPLEQKRPDVAWDSLLGGEAEASAVAGWPAEEVLLTVASGIINADILLLHKASKTLIVCDLAFNLPHPTSEAGKKYDLPWLMTWYLWLSDGYRPCCVTKPFAFLIHDPAALKAGLLHILDAWDFDRLVMAHGQVVHSGGKEALRQGTYDFVCKLLEKKQAPRQPWLSWKTLVVAAGVTAAAVTWAQWQCSKNGSL